MIDMEIKSGSEDYTLEEIIGIGNNTQKKVFGKI